MSEDVLTGNKDVAYNTGLLSDLWGNYSMSYELMMLSDVVYIFYFCLRKPETLLHPVLPLFA
jgi:hypothetical protein